MDTPSPTSADDDAIVGRYEALRNQLHAAYLAPVWDSARIDRIADELAPVERRLAALDGHRLLPGD